MDGIVVRRLIAAIPLAGMLGACAAAARAAQARAALRIAGAGLYPSLLLSAEAEYAKRGGSAAVETYGFGPEIEYEIDVWGRNRNIRSAAGSALLSNLYAWQALKLRPTADVANSYFPILSLNDRIRMAEDNLSNARRLLDLVKIQRGDGRQSNLELARQLEQVASREAEIPGLVHSRQLAQSALAVLLGRHQSDTWIGSKSLRGVTMPSAPSGMPSRLVERRSDIRSAEEDLIGARPDQQHHDKRARWIADRNFDTVLVHANPCFARMEKSFRPTTPPRTPVRRTGFVVPDRVTGSNAQRRSHVLVSAGGGAAGYTLFRAAIEAQVGLWDRDRITTRLIAGPLLRETQWLSLCELSAGRLRAGVGPIRDRHGGGISRCRMFGKPVGLQHRPGDFDYRDTGAGSALRERSRRRTDESRPPAGEFRAGSCARRGAPERFKSGGKRRDIDRLSSATGGAGLVVS